MQYRGNNGVLKFIPVKLVNNLLQKQQITSQIWLINATRIEQHCALRVLQRNLTVVTRRVHVCARSHCRRHTHPYTWRRSHTGNGYRPVYSVMLGEGAV